MLPDLVAVILLGLLIYLWLAFNSQCMNCRQSGQDNLLNIQCPPKWQLSKQFIAKMFDLINVRIARRN